MTNLKESVNKKPELVFLFKDDNLFIKNKVQTISEVDQPFFQMSQQILKEVKIIQNIHLSPKENDSTSEKLFN